MADASQVDLTEEEATAFIAMLEAWGEGLDAREKRVLSTLVGAALSTRDDADVQGYIIDDDKRSWDVLGGVLARSRMGINIGIGELW